MHYTRFSIFSFSFIVMVAFVFAPLFAQSAFAARGVRPIATTQVAGGIVDTSAVLQGSVNPGNVETMYWFEYGTTLALGYRTDIESAGTSNSEVLFSERVGNLIPNTRYYVRIIAQNAYGRSEGTTLSFATNSMSVTNTPTYTSYGAPSTGSSYGAAPVIVDASVSFDNPVHTIHDSVAAADCLLISAFVMPQPVVAGESVTYALTYRNGCTYALQNAEIKVLIPAGFVIDQRTDQGTGYVHDAYGVHYLLDTIMSGEQRSILLSGTVPSVIADGSTLLFHTSFSYTDTTQHTYMSVVDTTAPIMHRTGLTASVSDAFGGLFQSGWFALALLLVIGFLVYRFMLPRARGGRSKKHHTIDVLKA